MPRPGTRVIPAEWSQHHRPTVEKTMTATVDLRRPTDATTFDETAGKSVYVDPAILWSGPARLQRIARRGGEKEIGDRFAIVQTYQVSLPQDAPAAQIDDQIAVITSGDDNLLNSLLLRVREVRGGSLIWSRDLMCEEVTPTTR